MSGAAEPEDDFGGSDSDGDDDLPAAAMTISQRQRL